MVDISTNTSGSINISANTNGSLNVNSNSSSNVNANTNANAQRAKSWAVGTGLIDGEDYSAKYWAGQAKISENIASNAIQGVDDAANQAIEDIETAQNEALENLETAKDEKITEIEETAIDYGVDLTELAERAETAAGNAEAAETAVETALTNYYTKSETYSQAEVQALLAAQPEEIFIAKYNVTSYSDLSTAYNAGKCIFCEEDRFDSTKGNITRIYRLSTYEKSVVITPGHPATHIPLMIFTSIENGVLYIAEVDSSSNWTKTTLTIPKKTSELTNDSGFITGVTSNDVITALGYTPVNSSNLSTVATSGSYNDLTNKPTIPTVNNGTLTIQANSTTVGTFTANQSGDTTANITIPTDTADLTNGANFVNTTDLATKVDKSGDTMTGGLVLSNSSLYLTGVASTVSASSSKMYFGTPSSYYAYIGANTSGNFGIYNSAGKGVGCYPAQCLYPTNNIDLGRSNSKWKDIYASGKLYGASTNISITNLISYANAGATAIQPNDNISGLTNDAGYITNSALSDYITTSTLTTTLTDYVETTTLTSTLTDYVTTSTLTSTLTDYVETTTLATVATSGSYNDLTDKPTIPTVNDATITFTQGGTTKGTITLNQSSDATITLDAGGGGSITVDQTYDGTSANAQSGVAMAGELANYTKTANLPLTPYYATSTTAADTATKEVSIPAITSLQTGQIICVKPTITSTVATSKIKLNDFTAYNMRYNGANITTSTDSVVWNENWVSWFIFDGTYWQFAGHGYDNNTNTTYSAMSVSEGTTGTATNSRTVRADYLKQIIQGTKLTGLSTADNSAVVATDSILTGIGKLQAEVNNTIPADNVDYLLSDREDAFDIQSPLTMTYTLNGDGSLENGITMNSDGTLTTGYYDLWIGFDKEFGTGIRQTDYWEFNFKFKRISTSSTAVPFFVVDDGIDNFVELYLTDYNIPTDTWIYCNVLHREGASNVEFRYTIDGTETLVNDVLASGYTLSSSSYVNLMGLGISEVFSLDWNTYYRTSPVSPRYVFTERTLGADLSSKQDALVSGTNIKTINNTSLLGSGNISTLSSITYTSATETITIS